MTGKAKKIIFLSVGAYAATTLLLIGLFQIWLWAPWLKKPVEEYYSNDDNFFSAKGRIGDYVSKPLLSFEWVEVEGERTQDLYSLSPYSGLMRIHAPSIDEAWEKLSPTAGMEITFVFAYGRIDAQLSAPIVQISCKGEEILPLEDGRSALMRELRK